MTFVFQILDQLLETGEVSNDVLPLLGWHAYLKKDYTDALERYTPLFLFSTGPRNKLVYSLLKLLLKMSLTTKFRIVKFSLGIYRGLVNTDSELESCGDSEVGWPTHCLPWSHIVTQRLDDIHIVCLGAM